MDNSTTGGIKTSYTTGASRPKVDVNELWRQAERTVQCTCGLNSVGYTASAFVSHMPFCTVTEAYQVLFGRAVLEAN